MKSPFYKPYTRYYFDEDTGKWLIGKFIARGEQADGHLAYTRIDENGEDIEGEETSYVQIVYYGKRVMFHI